MDVSVNLIHVFTVGVPFKSPLYRNQILDNADKYQQRIGWKMDVVGNYAAQVPLFCSRIELLKRTICGHFKAILVLGQDLTEYR